MRSVPSSSLQFSRHAFYFILATFKDLSELSGMCKKLLAPPGEKGLLFLTFSNKGTHSHDVLKQGNSLS
jgi:hypothetical protein